MKLVFAIALALVCAGCSLVRPPERYAAGQNFGDGGATPCLDGYGQPVINQPRQWLKCCE